MRDARRECEVRRKIEVNMMKSGCAAQYMREALGEAKCSSQYQLLRCTSCRVTKPCRWLPGHSSTTKRAIRANQSRISQSKSSLQPAVSREAFSWRLSELCASAPIAATFCPEQPQGIRGSFATHAEPLTRVRVSSMLLSLSHTAS